MIPINKEFLHYVLSAPDPLDMTHNFLTLLDILLSENNHFDTLRIEKIINILPESR